MYAHDHTVKEFPKTKYNNLHFVKLGIGAKDTNELKTLDTLIRDYGHTDRVINYLKVLGAPELGKLSCSHIAKISFQG